MPNKITVILLTVLLFISCKKVDVTFGEEPVDEDPNVVFHDDYKVDIATYKVDSFITSADSVFSIGHHIDPEFGTIMAGTYAEVLLPGGVDLKDKELTFDSLVIILRPNGDYFGDTLLPFKINVHRLLENIENEEAEDINFFNSRTFKFDPAIIGQATIASVRPERGAAITVRLSDALGEELLQKFQDDDDEIKEQIDFSNYFRGLFLQSDLATNSMYGFNLDSTNAIMRLHYRLNSANFAEEQYFDFVLGKHFNSISYDHTGTNLATFRPFKEELKQSSVTGNKSYLHSNMGSYVKISFPNILDVKELFPFIQIIEAQLVIKPSPGTFEYPYRLPDTLVLQITNDNNDLLGLLTDQAGQALTGNLFIDELFGENTQYTYDLTAFITSLINEGEFSETALILASPGGVSGNKLDRLVINDQTLTLDDSSIRLNLTILGL